MKLLTFAGPVGPRVGVIVVPDTVLDLAASRGILPSAGNVPDSLREVVELGAEGMGRIRACLDELPGSEARLRDAEALLSLDALSLLPPIPDPRLILAVGLNYWKHLEEMAGTPVPKHPAAFMKAQISLLGSGQPVEAPPQCPDMIDFEGELCVVMGSACHDVAASDAMKHVAGYTLVNDVSARNWVHEVFAADGTFPAIHAWERNINGKQLPGFTPCGPVMVTRDEIADPHDLYMETRLNGRVMQATRTDDMIFDLPDVIAYFSRWYRFQPGDLITTGSPAGVGFGRDPKVFMRPGDVVEVEVEGIGVLTSRIQSA